MRFSVRGSLVLALTVGLLGARPAVAQEPKHDFFAASDGVRIHYMTLGESGTQRDL